MQPQLIPQGFLEYVLLWRAGISQWGRWPGLQNSFMISHWRWPTPGISCPWTLQFSATEANSWHTMCQSKFKSLPAIGSGQWSMSKVTALCSWSWLSWLCQRCLRRSESRIPEDLSFLREAQNRKVSSMKYSPYYRSWSLGPHLILISFFLSYALWIPPTSDRPPCLVLMICLVVRCSGASLRALDPWLP